MSIKVMSLVWERSQHKGSDLLLLVALADIGDDEGRRIYPSIGFLARKTRMSERGVQVALQRLKSSGELSITVNGHVHAGGMTTNEFQIKIQQLGVKTLHPRRKCTTPPQDMHHPPAESAPNPLGEPQEETLLDDYDGAVAQKNADEPDAVEGMEQHERASLAIGLSKQMGFTNDLTDMLIGKYGRERNISRVLLSVAGRDSDDETALRKARMEMAGSLLEWMGVEDSCGVRTNIVKRIGRRRDAIELIGRYYTKMQKDANERRAMGLFVSRLLNAGDEDWTAQEREQLHRKRGRTLRELREQARQ